MLRIFMCRYGYPFLVLYYSLNCKCMAIHIYTEKICKAIQMTALLLFWSTPRFRPNIRKKLETFCAPCVKNKYAPKYIFGQKASSHIKSNDVIFITDQIVHSLALWDALDMPSLVINSVECLTPQVILTFFVKNLNFLDILYVYFGRIKVFALFILLYSE